MSGLDEPLTSAETKHVQGKLASYKIWKKELCDIPDQHPVVKPVSRPKGASNLFFYRLAAFNYVALADLWFDGRNKTYKKNFAEYLTQLYSMLIEPTLLSDGTLPKESTGVSLQSLDLKRISRNYSGFNRVLFENRFLELIAVHDADNKKARIYAAPIEILRKGIEKVFLSKEQKRSLVKTVRVSRKADQTNEPLETVCRYFSRQLKSMSVDLDLFSEMELEVGQFRKIYPRLTRFQKGKHDLKINSKEGRFYSTYIQSPKLLRRLLLWKGKQKLVEGDVAGSHFHFFLEFMTDAKERAEMKRDLLKADPYLAMCSYPKGVSRVDLKGSSHQFKYGSRLKRYPKVSDSDWAELRMKRRSLLYREGLFYKHVSKKYPVFAATMAGMKIFGKNQKSKFACGIMKREAKVMVNMVADGCMKAKLVYLPIHDGFLTLPTQYDRVCQIVTECFKLETGSVPTIKRK